MPRERKLSPQAIAVLHALEVDPTRWRHGYDLAGETGLSSGSLYPILMRLDGRALLESSWEEPGAGRPPRHLYRITRAGAERLAAERPAPRRAPATTRPQFGRA